MLAVLLVIGGTLGIHGQATIAFDNQFNTNLTGVAVSQGAVFDPFGNLNTGNFNLELWGGPSVGSLTLIARLLQSDGSIASGNAIGAPGLWIDTTGQTYTVPGVAALATGFFQVDGWIGNFNSYAAAIFGGAADTGLSAIFQNATGVGAVTAPAT